MDARPGIPDYLGKLNSPILSVLIVTVNAKKLASFIYKKSKRDLSRTEINFAKRLMIKEYQRAPYVNGSFVHKKIKDSKGRIWAIAPVDKGGIECKMKQNEFGGLNDGIAK